MQDDKFGSRNRGARILEFQSERKQVWKWKNGLKGKIGNLEVNSKSIRFF